MKISKFMLGISFFALSFNSNAYSDVEESMMLCAAYADVTARDAITYPLISGGEPSPLDRDGYINFITTSRLHLMGVAQNNPLPEVVSRFKELKQFIVQDSGRKTDYRLNATTFNRNNAKAYLDYNVNKFLEHCKPITGTFEKTKSAYDSEKELGRAADELKEEFENQRLKW